MAKFDEIQKNQSLWGKNDNSVQRMHDEVQRMHDEAVMELASEGWRAKGCGFPTPLLVGVCSTTDEEKKGGAASTKKKKHKQKKKTKNKRSRL